MKNVPLYARRGARKTKVGIESGTFLERMRAKTASLQLHMSKIVALSLLGC
jgi:hypothetical protein